MYTQPSGDTAGFCVAPTSLWWGHDAKDPTTYVNAESINYIVLPESPSGGPTPFVASCGVHIGDVAAVYNRQTKQVAYAIYAENGDPDKLGEGSMFLGRNLGFDDWSATSGGQKDKVTYVLFTGSWNTFPGSSLNTPKTQDQIDSVARPLFAAWGGAAGGAARIEAMFATTPT